jgi:hypothetical protein
MSITNFLSNISHYINKNFSLQEVFNKNVKETLATSISVINNISKNTTGFENLIDSELDFDNDTKVFSITPTLTSYKIYRDGTEYIISTPITTNITTTGLMGYNIDLRKTSGNTSRLAHVDFYRSFKLFTTRTP